jgi:hypothetical protein
MHYVKELSIHLKLKWEFKYCHYKTRKGYLSATLFQNNTQWKFYFLEIFVFIIIFILIIIGEAKKFINLVDHFA